MARVSLPPVFVDEHTSSARRFEADPFDNPQHSDNSFNHDIRSIVASAGPQEGQLGDAIVANFSPRVQALFARANEAGLAYHRDMQQEMEPQGLRASARNYLQCLSEVAAALACEESPSYATPQLQAQTVTAAQLSDRAKRLPLALFVAYAPVMAGQVTKLERELNAAAETLALTGSSKARQTMGRIAEQLSLAIAPPVKPWAQSAIISGADSQNASGGSKNSELARSLAQKYADGVNDLAASLEVVNVLPPSDAASLSKKISVFGKTLQTFRAAMYAAVPNEETIDDALTDYDKQREAIKEWPQVFAQPEVAKEIQTQ